MIHATLARGPIRGLATCRRETGAARVEGRWRDMQLAISMELYSYWNALRAGRSAPERNDVEPGAIRGILADTFVLDFDKERGFPFRIAGSRANALFLKELRGLSFLQLWREADRKTVKSVIQRLADETQPFLLIADAKPPGLESLQIETLLLPLRHQGSAHSRILGCIAVKAQPHWLWLVGAGPARLISSSPLDSDKPPEGSVAPPAADRGRSAPHAQTRRGRLPFGWLEGPRT